jgi:hypothetical protein
MNEVRHSLQSSKKNLYLPAALESTSGIERTSTKLDIRGFHNAVLENGALPLDLLEQKVRLWIKRQ